MNHELNAAQRLAVLETQMDRFCSDMESEKRTRANAHAEQSTRIEKVNERLARVERALAVGTGAIIAAQIAIKYLMK